MTPRAEVEATAVLCHAHPLHGGVMHYKLLYRIAKLLRDRSFAVLRFNFRGVGRSEGEHDEGRGERDDTRAALDVLDETYPGLPTLAGGFSFGSVMALRVGVEDPRVTSMLAMGFPADVLKSTRFLGELSKPTMFVHGGRDRYGSQASIERVVAPLSTARLVIVPESDHFFTDRIASVEAAVSDWVELL